MRQETKFSFATRIKDRIFPLNIIREPLQNVTCMHCHEFTELVVVYAGEGLHAMGNGKPMKLVRGNVFVIPQGVYHRYLDEKLSLVNVIFEPDLLPLPLLDVYAMPYFNMIFKGKSDLLPKIFKITENELEEVLPLIEKLELELGKHLPGHQFMATALFMQIVMCLARMIGGQVENSSSPLIDISRVIEYFHRHFTEAISIRKLAQDMGMSMSSLLRHFKQITGVPPKEYVIRLRINHACELLNFTNYNIKEIVAECGFNDSNYFSRGFRKITGVSPTEFKKKQDAVFSHRQESKKQSSICLPVGK